MTLNELYKKAVLALESIENGETDARIIIKKVLSVNETEFLLSKHLELPDEKIKTIDRMIDKRLSGIPVQYIIGEWDFYGTTFKVNENVLIPRPETEFLCENVIDCLKGKNSPIIADLCAGSGCIGITIKNNVSDSTVILVEKSPEAAEICRQNIADIIGEASVTLINGDIYECEKFTGLPLFDIIISNPPYIKSSEIPTLQTEVLKEPEMALDGGVDGLDFYRLLTEKWTEFLKEDGMFAFECGEEQADDIRALLEKKDFDVIYLKDYNNIDRFVIGKRRKK